MQTVIIIDPPSGWRHGFPKPLPDDFREVGFNLRDWFLENNYPEEDIELALKYSRYWERSLEDE